MRNKKRNSLIAWAMVACLVIPTFAGCQKKAPQAVETTQATQATQDTTPQDLSALQNVEISGSLSSWEMSSRVWSSSNGATITFTAIPKTYSKDLAVYFDIHLNGEKIESIPCTWDGKYYTASVDLEAADGYEYECVTFQGQGDGESITLSDAYDALVNLERSLAVGCHLFISDFKVENGKFEVTAGFAYVQLPQLTPNGTSISFQGANLVFLLNGEPIETQAIDLPAGEGVGTREASLSSISFNMPQMDDEYQLDLRLDVSLSNGETLSENGGSWFYNNGELRMSAG